MHAGGAWEAQGNWAGFPIIGQRMAVCPWVRRIVRRGWSPHGKKAAMSKPMQSSKDARRVASRGQRVIAAGEAAKRRVAQAVEVRRPQAEAPKTANEKALSTFVVEMLRAWTAP